MMQQNRKIKFSIFIVCCLISIWLYFLFSAVVFQDSGYIYYVKPGVSKHAVIYDLNQRGIIPHPIALSFYALPQKNAALKAGEYQFKKGSTPHSIWKQMTTGTGLYYRPIAIIPGWTFKQLRAELLKAEELRHTTASLDDKQIMERLGYPNLSPEGEFFPDTYKYTRGDVDFIILKRAFNLMQSRLNEVWKNRAENLPFKSPYEALIVASIIEREAYLDSERPIIAGVLMNRLGKEMLLQIDATVIFGLGNRYTGKIYKQDLLEDTPYNTYLHKGLPPTPIAMPGLSSLKAATHPEQNDYFYYVAKGNGGHEFSATLDAHHTAVESTKKQDGRLNESLFGKGVEYYFKSQ